MSDTEQAALAAMLEEVPVASPLAEAAQARQEAEHAEWEAQVAYQERKARARAVRERIAQLQRLETTAPRREDVLVWRTERRTLEHALTHVHAELTAADTARLRANAAMVRAQAAHSTLCESASRLYRKLKVAAVEAENPDLTAREQLDAEARAEAAFQDLCGLIGHDEACRLRDGSERPAWFRS